MKPLRGPVFFRAIVILCFVLSIGVVKSSHNEIAHSRITRDIKDEDIEKTLKFVDTAIKSDLAKKLADNFKKIAPLLGIAGDAVTVALFFISDDDPNDERFKEMKSKLEVMDTKLDSIADQISGVHSSLSTIIEYQTQKIITVQKLNNLIDIINNIKSAENQLGLIISSYTTNAESLSQALDAFILKAKGDDYGFKLVSCLDTGYFTANSLADDLIKHGREYIKETRWSTTTMMYNVYLSVASYVFRENELLQVAIKLKGKVSETNVDEDLRYLSNNRNNAMATFRQSVRNVEHKLSDNDSVQLLNLEISSADKIVRMTNFLQIYHERENVISNEDTCTRTCEDYSNIGIHINGCYGTARDCKYFYLGSFLTYQNPQVDRIYTKMERTVMNLYPDESNNQKWFSLKPRGFVSCDICECICDQHDMEHTIRRFYLKPIAAPTGFVVTGTRFVEKDRTIFLQIEVGKLLPMGLIDQNSVYWQELPNDSDTANYYSLGFDKRSVLFNNFYTNINDRVVTGFAFEIHDLGVKLRIYKKKIDDFILGNLGDEVHYSAALNSEDTTAQVEDISDKTTKLIQNQSKIMKITQPIGFKFGMSSADDFRQSCVPYFDGSDVTFGVKVPLSDITFLRYTNDDAYAGYIRPLLKSIDYNRYFFSK